MLEKKILILYVAGFSPASELALKNLKELISRESETLFELKVIDVRKHPQLAEYDKILAIPTLIMKLPPPARKIIGDLSDKTRVLLSLNLIPQKN